MGGTSMAPPPQSGIRTVMRAASPRPPWRPPSAIQDVAASALAAPTSMLRPCSPGEVQLKRRRGLRLGVPQIADLMLRRPSSLALQPRCKSARTCSPHALAAPEFNLTLSAPPVGASASPPLGGVSVRLRAGRGRCPHQVARYSIVVFFFFGPARVADARKEWL